MTAHKQYMVSYLTFSSSERGERWREGKERDGRDKGEICRRERKEGVTDEEGKNVANLRTRVKERAGERENVAKLQAGGGGK